MLVSKLFICGKVHIQAILSSTFYLQSGHKEHVRCPFKFLAMYMHKTADIHCVCKWWWQQALMNSSVPAPSLQCAERSCELLMKVCG